MAKLIMVGTCPNCGAEVVSRYPFEVGICRCSNPAVEISLKPVLELSGKLLDRVQRIADLSGIPLEKLVNSLLLEAGKAVLEGKLKIEYRL